MPLGNEHLDKLLDKVIEDVEKDVTNAFPLIINKSFDCLKVSEILGVNEESTLNEAAATLTELKKALTEDIMSKVNEVINEYK